MNSNHGQFGIDLSIEGMRSQRFSVGVFFFLILGILVFCTIMFYIWKDQGPSRNIKRGEKVMFGAIIGGVIVAVIFGASQMINGFLF
jgi:hypothetical protein